MNYSLSLAELRCFDKFPIKDNEKRQGVWSAYYPENAYNYPPPDEIRIKWKRTQKREE